MARPIKESEPLDKVLPPIRVTAQQAYDLKAKAEAVGLGLSDFVRAELTKAKPRQRRKPAPHEVEAVKALGRLGNIRADINKILKDRFSHVFVHPQRMEDALKSLENLADEIHLILKNHGH